MKKYGAGKRLIAWMLSMMLVVQGLLVLPRASAEETLQMDDVVSVRTMDKDILMAVTPNSPYSIEEISEKLDLDTVLAGQSSNVSTTNIDTTDLSNWYVYDHYDTVAYAGKDATTDEAKAVWAEENGYNQNLRPFYGYTESYAVDDEAGYTMEEAASKGAGGGNVYHLKEHIAASSENGKAAMNFYGYGSPAYADFLYYPADASGTKKVEYTIDAKDVKTHSLAHAGFLFNCGITTDEENGKLLTGYAIMFEYVPGGTSQTAVAKGIKSVNLYKLNNIDVNTLHNNSSGWAVFSNLEVLGSEKVSLIATKEFSTTTDPSTDTTTETSTETTTSPSDNTLTLPFTGHFDVSDIVLKITANSFVATMTEAGEEKANPPEEVTLFNIQGGNNNGSTNAPTLESTGYGGFGPIIAYEYHGCKNTSTYKYSNLMMSITESDSVLSGLLDADFTKSKLENGEYKENDKYFILLGDKNPGEAGYTDCFKLDFDDVYLEMLKNQHVILVTNLNIEGLQDINGTNYKLADYLGAGNVIQLKGKTPDALAAEIRDIVSKNQYDYYAAEHADNALDKATGGTGHEKSAATLAVRYNGYQVDSINSSRLPEEGITLTLDTEGSIGVSDEQASYTLRKPGGKVVTLEDASITITPSDAKDWPSGEYVAMVSFEEGAEASTKFYISAYYNSYFNNVADAEGIASDGLYFTKGTVGTNKVIPNADYEVLLHPDDGGYKLPDKLFVYADTETSGTVVDEDGVIRNSDGEEVTPKPLVQDEDYTYDKETGEVRVNKDSITGNLYFYADTSKVTYQLVDAAVSGEARDACSLYDDEDFSVTLTASGDAKLPETVRVTIGEQSVELSDPSTTTVSGETVSYENGTITIAKELLGDDIVIATNRIEYQVTSELTNLQSSNKQSVITPDEDYETTLIPDEGYELPDNVIVAIGEQQTYDYSYDSETGVLKLGKEILTGDVLIVAEGKKIEEKPEEPAKEYSVTYYLTNLTTTGAKTANSKEDYVTKLAPVGNYRLPGDFTITVAGKELKAGEGYGYNGITGTITIPASEITGDIVITATGVVFEQTSQPKPDTSNLVVIPPKYEDSKDGKIIGVTLDMEYSVDNGKTWTRCSSNTISNLGVGTVKIRFYGTDLKKSSPAASIEIESSTSEYYIPTIYMTKKMGLNQKFQLKLVNTKGAAIKYSSSNTKLVTVNKKGVITSRKKTGKAKVVITLIKGKHIVQYVAKVTVDKKVKKNYSLAKFKTTYKSPTIAFYKNVGKDKSWKIKLTHTNNATITFKSSDESVAVVDKKGRVSGVSAGKATITIKVNNQGVVDKYYAVVRVTDENVPTDVSYLKVLK